MEEEFDTSAGELDPVALLQQSRMKPRSSTSLFDLEIDVAPVEEAEKSKYEKNLLKESHEWNDLLKDKHKYIEKLESNFVVIEKSLLTAEQFAYCEQGPKQIKEFIQKLAVFEAKALDYLEKHSDLMKVHDDLAETCETILDRKAFDIIDKCFKI